MKKQITKSEYLQILGLMTLARDWSEKAGQAQKAIEHICEDREECGHVPDAIFGKYGNAVSCTDEMLLKMGVTVDESKEDSTHGSERSARQVGGSATDDAGENAVGKRGSESRE